MDIWEKTMLNGEKVYKCPDCGCYSYVNLNFCPECGDYMRTSGGKFRFEGLKKRPLGVLKGCLLRSEMGKNTLNVPIK